MRAFAVIDAASTVVGVAWVMLAPTPSTWRISCA